MARARLRVGPFTIGRTGIRLSTWGKFGGISIPLNQTYTDASGKERPNNWHAMGKLGPARGHAGGNIIASIIRWLAKWA